MALQELTPLQRAIATIDETIADLQRRKRELESQLPPSEHTCKRVEIIDPRGSRKKTAAKRTRAVKRQ